MLFTLTAMCVFFCVVGSLGTCLGTLYDIVREYELAGPGTSQYSVNIRVSDAAPFSVGADFYADVTVVSRDGQVQVDWQDPTGQDSHAAVKRLVQSMKWRDDSTLVFTAKSGTVLLKRDKLGEWSIEEE